MKAWITCTKCGEENKVYCGTGKAAQRKAEWLEEVYVCESCYAKEKAEQKAAEDAKKVESGWKAVTVPYRDYKNEYESAVNVKGEEVQAGEYHHDTKEIDLLLPPGKLVKLTENEKWDLKDAIWSVENGEELEPEEAAVLALFEETDESEEKLEPEEETVWSQITVPYSVYKKKYAGAVNVKGERVRKGEYHDDTKEIDLEIPSGRLLVLSNSEKDLLKRNHPLPINETRQEFESKKAALLAKFAEPEEEEEPEEKIEWKSLEINSCFAGRKHGKSRMFYCPESSDYAGYVFWHPIKCIKKDEWGETYYIRYNDDWKFRLTANGGALEENLTAEEFEKAISASDWSQYEKLSEHHVPLKLEAIENPEAIEELIDNDQQKPWQNT